MNVIELIKRLKEERIQGSSAVLNYSNFDYWVNWDDIVEIVEDHDQPQLNENQLQTIKSWGNLAAGEFGQEWTEDDELAYRELFGESLTVLSDEIEEEG